MESDSLDRQSFQRLLWMTASLFMIYLGVAMALPAVSVHVSETLGLGNVEAGLAVGVVFFATILSRGWVGGLADSKGGKVCLYRGLAVYFVASVLSMASAWPSLSTMTAYWVLIVGRFLLGLGESLVIVGLLAWAMAIAGPGRSGRVMSLAGIGTYGAFGVGGPIGLWLLGWLGFGGLMAVCCVLPFLGWAMLFRVPAAKPPAGGERAPFLRVVGRIWREGLVIFLQGFGFAALGAFVPLYFISQGWQGAGFGMTCFGFGFVVMRMVCGGLPDRLGGAPVAAGSLVIEIIGQAMLWLAPNATWAFVGALFTGAGCSMMFPAMGLEAIKRVPAHLSGTAIGGFAAFQDLAYGGTGPIAGLVADKLGYAEVFLFGMVAGILGLVVVLMSLRSYAADMQAMAAAACEGPCDAACESA